MSLFVLTPERWAASYGAEWSSPVIRVRVTTDAGATWTDTSPGPCIDPAVVAGYHHWAPASAIRPPRGMTTASSPTAGL
ncbi:MAG: hypothetical protein M0031_08625 [Thermaerobacter sp.]|nr:hypothetical protein [Thermaerobacter sp.]